MSVESWMKMLPFTRKHADSWSSWACWVMLTSPMKSVPLLTHNGGKAGVSSTATWLMPSVTRPWQLRGSQAAASSSVDSGSRRRMERGDRGMKASMVNLDGRRRIVKRGRLAMQP